MVWEEKILLTFKICKAKLFFFNNFLNGAARQMGFSDASECPQLCKLAYDYLRKSEGCENSIYDYFSNEPEAKSLYRKLIGEFETCILSYFAFHWGHASLMISQVQFQIKPEA